MSSLLFESLRTEAIPAFAAATQGARLNFNSNSSRRSSSGKAENECAEAVFDEFGAFEQIREEEQTLYVIERQHEENESEDEAEDEDDEEVLEQMVDKPFPPQRNSPALIRAKEEQPKKFEKLQKASPKAAVITQPAIAVNTAESAAESGHTRAATDPLSSAALSRMRYYRKLVPAPKSQNTSPKSEPHASNHLPNSNNNAAHNMRFAFPPSHSAAALFYQPNNRSAPIAIPSKKSSPTNDESHRFRAAVHPRIAADSSFVLPAASYLPSAFQKSFVPQGNDNEPQEYSLRRGRGLARASNGIVSANVDEEQFGFEFEMDP